MNTPTPKDGAVSQPGVMDARFILAVLFAVSILNFVDRQLLGILAGEVKADLRVTDGQLGFLYGTVFGIFYAVFGVPLGVYADLGSRRKLIAWGLGLWSVMTALSGMASGFATLAMARVGVGVGEASASPAAYSLLSDLFPRARRATAIAIYSLGIYVGIGLSSYLGGAVVAAWKASFPAGGAPFGLRGWQVAFLVAGLPGLLLVPLVLSFREPPRGAMEAAGGEDDESRIGGNESNALARAFREGLALLPPFSFILLRRDGVAAASNLFTFVGLALGAAGLSWAFGDVVQWACVFGGLYVVATMATRLQAKEPEAFALIFKTRSLSLATLGFSALSFTGYVISFWTAQFFIRYHGFSISEIGDRLGLISAIGGGLGVTLGGVLADRLRFYSPSGRLMVGMMNALIPIPLLMWTLTTPDRNASLVFFAMAQVFAAMWLGAGVSTVQDLVLPHMRARASAVFLLFVTIVGLALGPYVVGRLSDLWGDLRLAFMAGTSSNVVAFLLFLKASQTIEHDEETRFDRAARARVPA